MAPQLDNTTGVCSPIRKAKEKGIITANSVCNTRQNMIPIRIYNISDYTITVNRGQEIALFTQEDYSDAETLPDPSVYTCEDDDVGSPHIPQCASVNTNKYNSRSDSTHTSQTYPDFDFSESDINQKQKGELKELLNEFNDCFLNPKNPKLGVTDLVTHTIETEPGVTPVQMYPNRSSPTAKKEIDKLVQKQLELGIIEQTYGGAWSSPTILVPKKTGGFRLFIDFRQLNQVTIPRILRIPRYDDICEAVNNTKPQYFSILDCTQGFHQIPLDEASKDKTAFLTPQGKYRYVTMPQGLTDAPAAFQSLRSE